MFPKPYSRGFAYLKGKAMSEYTENDDLDLEDEDTNDIRSLRKAANAAKRLRNEIASLKREIAFAKAGLPLDDPKMSYFIKGYDGELEPEAIRDSALQAGFIAPPESKQNQAQQVQQQAVSQAQQRVMAASAGATAEDVSESAALARMEAAMNEGGIEAMLDVARQYGIPSSVDY